MRIHYVLLLWLVSQTACSEESHCTAQEKIVFTCHVGKKVISLCKTQESLRHLTYRFGLPGHLELVYPDPKTKKKGQFYSASSPLYGGGATTIAFKRGAYEYKIFSKIGRVDSDSHQENRVPFFEDGIEISRKGKLLKRMVCDDGGEGFREVIESLISDE